VKGSFIILLLVISFFLGAYFGTKKCTNIVEQTTTDTVFVTKTDTIYKTAYIPHYTRVERLKTDTVTLTDTVYIVNDYKEVREYKDTIRDTSFVVYLTDSVTQNKIVSRSWHGETFNTEKTVLKERIVQDNRLQFGAGTSILYDNKPIPCLNIAVRKKNWNTSILYNPEIIGIQANWWW
jgi:hypothetical protein